MRSHLDKCMGERDNYAKQVKELKDKRMAVTDELYDKYKAAADSRATGMSTDSQNTTFPKSVYRLQLRTRLSKQCRR